ncbi:EF-hand calcium-binding domain-containing protein 14 isoform X4 [Ochotona curzoniae]|uniref:EF-hand calcium-binding domain-containing protein 14 isoform X4 n=1 Tax=Ochotona curzoniae TaxID=130825 RepID=UPI001B34865E|nr:EF-hand calcium-binding domain-containing protein 14 isoform X4 [Ochotona curzoniae]
MKKRRELNALIGLAGDSRRKKSKKGSSSHRLLRTEPPDSDTESSSEEEEEFGVAGNRSRFVKGDYLRCCKICYPLCAFVILAACVMACVGLVWMQVALKEDLDALKEKFRTMESNQKNSFQEIPKLNEDLLTKQKQLEKIESGELGISKIWINITEMNKQISLLTSAVNHLKANVKSAADLISLPATVEGLQKSVASIGNTLNSVRLAVEAMQKTVDEQKETMELLQNNMNQHFSKETSGGNQIMSSPSVTSELDNKTQSENLKQKEDNSNSQVSKLKEKLQLISALANKPESNRPPENTEEEQIQNSTSKSSALPKSSQSSGDRIEKAAQPRSVFLPGVSSVEDLQDLFHKIGQDEDGKLTYQEIAQALGSATPEPESLRTLDSDGDGRYSFLELTAAVDV